MSLTASTTSILKNKTDWQLFTNNGKFDSKLPPYRRLRSEKSKSNINITSLYRFFFDRL